MTRTLVTIPTGLRSVPGAWTAAILRNAACWLIIVTVILGGSCSGSRSFARRAATGASAGSLEAQPEAQPEAQRGEPAKERSGSPAPGTMLTLERLFAEPSVTGTSPSAPSWSPDSRRLAFLWNDVGSSARDLWLVEADGSGLRSLTGAGAGVASFAWMPDGEALVFVRSGSLWRTRLEGGTDKVAELAQVGNGGSVGSVGSLDVSPDGGFASFLAAGDLWLVPLDDLSSGASPMQVTHVGQPSLSRISRGRYNRPDVEIGPGIWGGPTYAWSPDGKWIAVHHVDRRGLETVAFPDYLGEETDPNPIRRGYPGGPNESREVGLLRVATGELSLLGLPDPTAVAVVDFSWSRDGRLLVDRQSDTAVDRWLHVVDPQTREVQDVWHDRRTTRVYTRAGSAWLGGGQGSVFLSDLEDRYGLYEWRPDGKLPRRRTDAAFDVTSAPLVVPGPAERESEGVVFYEANEPSPYERHVFRSQAGEDAQRITRRPGSHRAYPSPDGETVALLHSDDRTPAELYLVDGRGASAERRITRSPPSEFDTYAWARVRYVTFPSKTDGAPLHARILEPPTLDPGRRYPVLFGPVYSNTVRNRWAGRWALVQQLLVQRGYLVVQVDVRGSTGYGRAFREDFLMDFAGRDLDDLESAVGFLRAQPHVDPGRIGVWGSSYGGTLTIYALLLKPGLFQAGVAAAAAVDPFFFGSDDVAIVRRPDTHPEAFLRGAAQHAGNLQDALLILHGMQDQVVPFKTTVALAEELMRQGKDFDFAFAPGATHGWTRRPHEARFLLRKLLDHFDRHLGVSGDLP